MDHAGSHHRLHGQHPSRWAWYRRRWPRRTNTRGSKKIMVANNHATGTACSRPACRSKCSEPCSAHSLDLRRVPQTGSARPCWSRPRVRADVYSHCRDSTGAWAFGRIGAMTDLTRAQVRRLLSARRLDVSADDLPEVTHRLNAMLEAVDALEHPGLDSIEPAPPPAFEPRGG